MLILGVYVAAQLIQANHSPFEHLNLTAKHSVLKLLVVFPLWFSFCAFTWCFLKQKSTLIISLFILGGIPLHFLDRATVYFNHRIKISSLILKLFTMIYCSEFRCCLHLKTFYLLVFSVTQQCSSFSYLGMHIIKLATPLWPWCGRTNTVASIFLIQIAKEKFQLCSRYSMSCVIPNSLYAIGTESRGRQYLIFF